MVSLKIDHTNLLFVFSYADLVGIRRKEIMNFSVKRSRGFDTYLKELKDPLMTKREVL